MNKYQNSKIYKIVDNGYNMVYYGSTINNLSKRFTAHKTEFKRNILTATSKLIFNEYGIENCKIELVENYPCNNRDELNAREGYYIKNNDCVNKLIAGRTQKEYQQENKDKIAEYKKEYQQENKDKIAEYQKEYQQENKDKIVEYKRQYYQSKKRLSHQN